MNQSLVDLVDAQVRRSELAGRALEQETVEPVRAWETVITISRQLGSGGRRVAEKLSEMLGYSIWDAELVDAIARDAHVQRSLVANFDEHLVSEIDVLVRHLAGEPRIGGFQFKHHLTRALLQISRLGSAIILGRGAHLVLPKALNVRIVASDQVRVQNMAEFEALTPQEAEKRIAASDRDRADFAKRTWGRDWADPLAYDLVLRMDEFSHEQASQIIISALQSRLNAQT